MPQGEADTLPATVGAASSSKWVAETLFPIIRFAARDSFHRAARVKRMK